MQIDRLYSNEVRLLLGSQKGTLDQVSSALGPHGAVKLSQSLTHLFNVLGEYFEEYLKSIRNSPDEELESRTATLVFAKYLGLIHNQYVRFLIPADPYSFPGELLHPIKDMLIKFGGYEKSKTSVGLFHWDKYNFGVIRLANPLTLIAQQIEETLSIQRPKHVEAQIKKLFDTFVFISYPQTEGRNVFLHGTLFHELGHAIELKKSISEPVLKTIKNWTGQDLNAPNVLKFWVKEIIADLVAIRLVGPCVLFSSRITSLTMGVMDDDCDTHPSSRFRALWMLEHLERLRYIQNDSKFKSLEILRNWHQSICSVALSSKSEKYKKYWLALRQESVIKALHESVEKEVGYGFTYDKFVYYMSEILANFNNHLPHTGENSDSTMHLACVLNAVWEKRFVDQENDATKEVLFKEQEIICGLALKSIEGNYIKAIWKRK